jgi:hypothetical protein
VRYEEGALNFWRELLAAIEADDGTAVLIINDRCQKAEVRLTEARRALALHEEKIKAEKAQAELMGGQGV